MGSKYNFEFLQVKKNYELVIERRYPFTFALGVLSVQRNPNYQWYPYHSLDLTLNALEFSEGGIHLLALSLMPIYNSAAAYTQYHQ